MPFARPTLAELVARVTQDLRTRIAIAGPLLRRAMADALSAAWAGVAHMMHGHLDWLSHQLFADTADAPYVLHKAAMYGITPIAATYATGPLTATGTNGTLIPANTIWVRGDGARFRVTADGTISGGSVSLNVQAVVAGDAGNTAETDTLTLESPIAGVNSTGTVGTGGLVGGVDQESVDGVRNRLLLRLQEPPEGGADQDYEAWALEVAGVTRAWVYPNENGLGTVVVRFVRDAESPIIPDAGEVAAVQTKLNEERPITAAVTALAPTDSPLNFTIHVVPDTSATRAAVTAELTDLLLRDAEPGDGVGRGTIKLSAIRTAIGIAEDVTDYTLTSPAADVVPTLGQLKTMGTVTWT